MSAFVSQILIDRVTSDPSNRHQSSLGTFANDPDDTFLQVKILKTSASQFADPQARRIKQLENCAISQWKRPALDVDLQEAIHLHLVQGLRQKTREPGQRKKLRRIFLCQGTHLEESKKDLKRDYDELHRCWSKTSLLLGSKVFGQLSQFGLVRRKRLLSVARPVRKVFQRPASGYLIIL